jgi:Predicted ATPase
VAIFKKIVTGERIKGEEKGEKEFFFKPYTKLLFSANTIPRIRDRTGAVIRRLVIVPFKATFSRQDADYDPFIKQKSYNESAAERIIALAIEGLERVLNNNAFTECEAAQNELESYEEENNPFIAWLNDHGRENIVNEETGIIYHRYTVFCAENQTQPMSRIGFTRNLCRELGLKIKIITANGKRIKIFIE